MNVDIEYAKLIEDILTFGVDSDDRTGVGTRAIFGAQLHVGIHDNTLPAISLRKVSPRIAFEELMFMLNGKHQTKELEEKKIKIWKGNTTREFLDKRGLEHLEEGDFGRMYGVQLRNFTSDSHVGYFDQLKYIVNSIEKKIEDPNCSEGRRIIATHYNPAEADMGALFPCHIMTQFNVRNGYLDCLFWMRSSDVGFGLPYNLMYYAMFTMLLAKLTNLKPGNLVYQSGDCHLYKDQIESGMIDYMVENLNHVAAKVQEPKFTIKKDIETLDDMLSLTWDDVQVDWYDPMPDFKNKPGMAV